MPERLGPIFIAGETEAQLRSRQKLWLRAVRKRQRSADSSMEKLERQILRLLDRKTRITMPQTEALDALFIDLSQKIDLLEIGLADFFTLMTG